MMTYLVIGLCIFLLLVVIFISAKPISMGIEARSNINNKSDTNVEGKEELIENYDKNIDMNINVTINGIFFYTYRIVHTNRLKI